MSAHLHGVQGLSVKVISCCNSLSTSTQIIIHTFKAPWIRLISCELNTAFTATLREDFTQCVSLNAASAGQLTNYTTVNDVILLNGGWDISPVLHSRCSAPERAEKETVISKDDPLQRRLSRARHRSALHVGRARGYGKRRLPAELTAAAAT